jgi:hypothetical protein
MTFHHFYGIHYGRVAHHYCVAYRPLGDACGCSDAHWIVPGTFQDFE